jgi:nitrogen regulatory protein PII
MYLLIAFISKTEKVHEVIQKMAMLGFTGCTIFDGSGLKSAIPRSYDIPLVASLHSIFDQVGQINKILFAVVENEDEVHQLTDIIEQVIGNLHEPNTGLVIAHKLDFVKGYDRWPNND